MSYAPPYKSNVWDVTQKVAAGIAQNFTHYAIVARASARFNFDLKNLPSDSWQVTVTPRREEHQRVTRINDESTYTVQILIQKKTADVDAEADDLFGFVEEIQKYLRDPERAGEGLPYASLEHETLYGDDHIQEFNQFTSVLNLTIRRIT